MANRILFIGDDGTPLCALDGHHGAAHAAAWVAATRTMLAEQGLEASVIELHPGEGGDAVRRGVVGNLHCLRAEWHDRPDGRRELVGLVAYGTRGPTGDDALATVGLGRGLTKRQAAAAPVRIIGAVRLLAAPSHVHGQRHPLRVGAGRRDPLPGQQRDPRAARLARQRDRAAGNRG